MIFFRMGTTPSPPKCFDFYDNHERSHFFVTIITRATLKNAIKWSLIKQKWRSYEIAMTNIFSVYIYVKTNMNNICIA